MGGRSSSMGGRVPPRPPYNLNTRRNHLLYHFSITIHLHLTRFYALRTFEKKLNIWEMLIEQIIESGPNQSQN